MICFARHTIGRGRTGSDAGFSLIEMLAVLVILSLIGWLSLSLNSQGRHGKTLELTARDLAATLRNARRQAISKNRIEAVAFDVGSRAVMTEKNRRRHKLPAGIGFDVTTAATAQIGASILQIRFFPDGSSSGGRIVLRERQRRIAIDVDWMTGAIGMSPGV